MHPARQRALLQRFMGFKRGQLPDRAAASVRKPASAYTDPARFEREMAVLFRARPIPIGLTCECLLQVTETEDFPMMEQIYQGLSSGAVPELTYGKLEPALVHYHRSLDRLLAEARS